MNTQTGSTPAEPSINQDRTETQLNRLWYPGTQLVCQPVIPFNSNNMLPTQQPIVATDQAHESINRRREARRRQRQRRAQRR